MKLKDVVSFRKDLLFHGAVQLGWFERNKVLSDKAAAHFIFHGPDYHGADTDAVETGVSFVDTATFTKEVTDRLVSGDTDEPFIISIAGYGTGKSHLALTLATLFSRPESALSQSILANLSLADAQIGQCVQNSIAHLREQPFLVVALNGMEDFDLSNEISRQILNALKEKDVDTGALENLRPRFKLAENFARAFHVTLDEDFREYFGDDYSIEEITRGLTSQDDRVFTKVNEIYKLKMGTSFPVAGQESLQDFIRVTSKQYCGPGKPFAGLLIIFDEFGRYIEFAAQKPHVAGPAALQQLYEAVQENAGSVFLLAFIQTELRAYASRVMPERRDEMERYLTRFDSVRKVRLSTNLETVIAHLIEKKDLRVIKEQVSSLQLDYIHSCMVKWFPDLSRHALWLSPGAFARVVGEGCWPLHPVSTWVLSQLTSVGKALQQRSALSLLTDVVDVLIEKDLEPSSAIVPTDLLTSSLLDEFKSSERMGTQRPITDSYQVVLEKYQHDLSPTEKIILGAIVLQQKIGIKVESRTDYIEAVCMFTGLPQEVVDRGLSLLEKEFGVLEWNGLVNQYEIIGDAVPRRTFLSSLERKVNEIGLDRRSDIFYANIRQWLDKDEFPTDFGEQNDISTREWNYKCYFSNVQILENQIQMALLQWRDAVNADTSKGQLIYCYVGPGSELTSLKERVQARLWSRMAELGVDLRKGAPIAILFLDDYEGDFGQKLAEYWVLESGFSDEEHSKFANFILDKKNSVKEELSRIFEEMEEESNVVFATSVQIQHGRLRQMLLRLFDVVYPERIPFPFDGFHTIRGNAAANCQTFTRELLLGNLDREWLQARKPQEKNRGYKVLDQAWRIFDKAGSVRLLPGNPRVRKLIHILHSTLDPASDEQAQTQSANLGRVVKRWMAPPFGCNLAAAGLLLATYLGRRQNELDLYYNNRLVRTEEWLARAMPTNFFDLTILDNTVVTRVSKDRASLWEELFEKWELEPTYSGRIAFMEKAEELSERVPLPQVLRDRYELLKTKTQLAVRKLNELARVLNKALSLVEEGNGKRDVSLLSWGAALLVEQYEEMRDNPDCWTQEQAMEVRDHYSTARIRTKQLFPSWLREQRETTIERLSDFRHRMKTLVGGNLEKMGLEDERRLLEKHVDEVEKNIRLLANIKASKDDTRRFLENKVVSERSPLADLQGWSEKAEGLLSTLQLAREQTQIGKYEIDKTIDDLTEFIEACDQQVRQHRSNAADIFNHRTVTCLADIADWRTEALEFRRIFAGYDQDVQDFLLIIKQLELLEKHYQRLDDSRLSDEELDIVLEQCQQELIEQFIDDCPPLDAELIYRDIMTSIRGKRDRVASQWIEMALAKTRELPTLGAAEVISIRKQLENMPAVLSEEQRKRVRVEIEACESRLDELEVEGLFAKFNDLSRTGKMKFLTRLRDYLEQHFDLRDFFQEF